MVAGLTMADLPLPTGVLALCVARGPAVLPARPGLAIQGGDELLTVCPTRELLALTRALEGCGA